MVINNKNTITKSFLKNYFTELKSQFTIIHVLVILSILLLSMITLIINSDGILQEAQYKLNIIKENENAVDINTLTIIQKSRLEVIVNDTSFRMINSAFIQFVTFMFMFKVYTLLKDKNGIDKNRVAYLYHNKHIVTASKILADIALFAFGMFIAAIIIPLWITTIGTGSLKTGTNKKIFQYVTSIIIIYVLGLYGSRLINSSVQGKALRLILVSGWLLITIFWFIIGSALFLIEKFGTFYIKNDYWAYIPLANFMAPRRVMLTGFPMVKLLPMFFYTILFISSTWNIYTKKVKHFLCG